MTQEAMRLEFEAWAADHGWSIDRSRPARFGDYTNADTNYIWLGWQASRAQTSEELLCVCGATWAIHGPGNHELISTPPSRAQGAAPTGASVDKRINQRHARKLLEDYCEKIEVESYANGFKDGQQRALMSAAPSNAEGLKPDGIAHIGEMAMLAYGVRETMGALDDDGPTMSALWDACADLLPAPPSSSQEGG